MWWTLGSARPLRWRSVPVIQVIFVIMRYMTNLRTVYTFYSRLGLDESPDNTFAMNRMQFWRFLKDCQLHHSGVPFTEMDRVIGEWKQSNLLFWTKQKQIDFEFSIWVSSASEETWTGTEKLAWCGFDPKTKAEQRWNWCGVFSRHSPLMTLLGIAKNLRWGMPHREISYQWSCKCWNIWRSKLRSTGEEKKMNKILLKHKCFQFHQVQPTGPLPSPSVYLCTPSPCCKPLKVVSSQCHRFKHECLWLPLSFPACKWKALWTDSLSTLQLHLVDSRRKYTTRTRRFSSGISSTTSSRSPGTSTETITSEYRILPHPECHTSSALEATSNTRCNIMEAGPNCAVCTGLLLSKDFRFVCCFVSRVASGVDGASANETCPSMHCISMVFLLKVFSCPVLLRWFWYPRSGLLFVMDNRPTQKT